MSHKERIDNMAPLVAEDLAKIPDNFVYVSINDAGLIKLLHEGKSVHMLLAIAETAKALVMDRVLNRTTTDKLKIVKS